MARFTSGQMMQPRKKTPQGVAPAPVAPKVSVKVPTGGGASMRRIKDGIVVSTHDAKWNNSEETFVPDGSSVSIE